MKAVISSLLLSATAVAAATNCDVSLLTEIASSADAFICKSASNFVVSVELTVNTILTDMEAFCDSDACQRVLDDLSDLEDCSIDGMGLLQSVVNPIGAVCSTTRALRGADGSHEHSPGMDMSLASIEMEDSHEATSSSMEDSHDTRSASDAKDSHDATSSTSASAEAGDEGSHDHTGSTAIALLVPLLPPPAATPPVPRGQAAT